MANMTFKASLLPSTDLGYSLGSNTQKWNIYGNLTGNASTASALNTFASIGSSSTTHDTALKNYFTSNYSSIPRNKTICFYDASGGNGSLALGYFLSGYDSNPYGGFFVAHYNTPYYVGIQNGTYTNQTILTSSNYTSYTVKKDGTGASGTWGISITGNAATSSSCTGNAATSSSCTGNAATATKLQTAHKINGTDFDGTADITTANWGTARTLTIGNKGQSVNGSQNITWNLQDILIRSSNEFNFTADGKSSIHFNHKTQSGTTATTKITDYYFKDGQGNTTGVTIHAANFNGNAASASKWATARTLTIGETGKEVDGTVNISWGKAEILGVSDTTKFYRGDQSWSNEISGGIFKVTNNKNTVSIGSQNESYTHFMSSADIPFYFNKAIYLDGDLIPYGNSNSKNLGSSSKRWQKLYIGTADSYGTTTQPIYWDNGVPTAITYTANRLYYPSAVNAFTAGTHFVSDTKIAINSTSNPSQTLYVEGQTKINNAIASSTINESSTLIISNSDSGNVALELWRNTNASWQLANESGVLYLRNNYTTAKQSSYTQSSLIIDYNTGNTAISGSLSVGQTTRNTSYKLYVNGTANITTSALIKNITISENNISSTSTLYLNRAANSSIIFQYNGTNKIWIDQPNNNFRPDVTNSLSLGTSTYRWKNLFIGTADNYGATDRPIYWNAGVPTVTTYRMSGTNTVATKARAITENLETGNWYVNGTNSTDLYSQNDGVAYVEKYSDNWIHEIYGDYRTGQIAIRGKNNGTWQAWRKVLDTGNYASLIDSRYVKKAGDTMTGSLACQFSNINASATNNNISSMNYPTTFNILDSGGRILTRLEALVNPNGNIGSNWYVRNYNTSGNLVAQKGIQMNMNKSGGLTYSIADPANFRSALGLGTNATSSTAYLPLAGGTMTGAINFNSRGACSIYNGPNDQGGSLGGTLSNVVINSWFGVSFTTTCSGQTYTGKTAFYINCRNGYAGCNRMYGAVWNDYAEYRKNNEKEKDNQKPGCCVKENGDGTLSLTTKRLERGCEIISDTFGFAIGQDKENGYDTPIASSGRVLAYPYESIEEFASHIGYAVCSGPNGTVSIMTDEEEEKYPMRAIGTISEIPDYEEWGTGKVKVNGRVWIRIR